MADELYMQKVRLLLLWASAAGGIGGQEIVDKIERTENIGMFVDPTLYRDYLYSADAQERNRVIRELAEISQRVANIFEKSKRLFETVGEG